MFFLISCIPQTANKIKNTIANNESLKKSFRNAKVTSYFFIKRNALVFIIIKRKVNLKYSKISECYYDGDKFK